MQNSYERWVAMERQLADLRTFFATHVPTEGDVAAMAALERAVAILKDIYPDERPIHLSPTSISRTESARY
ncbi:MAG: hypothetical protein WAX89_07260 [Alphaproteobacteria bacterium]